MRRASSLPSADSMANDRPRASRAENSTAIQNSPGAAWARTERRSVPEHREVGRDRDPEQDQDQHPEGQDLTEHHLRGQLDPEILAGHHHRIMEHRGHLPGPSSGPDRRPGPGRGPGGASPRRPDRRPGRRSGWPPTGPLQVVGGEQHRRPEPDGVADQVVDQVTAGRVEAAVWLVEEPQPGPATDHDRKRGPAALAGRQVRDPDRAEAAPELEAVEDRFDGLGVDPVGLGPEVDVLLDGQLVVQVGLVGQQAGLAPELASLVGVGQIEIEDRAGPPVERGQARRTAAAGCSCRRRSGP